MTGEFDFGRRPSTIHSVLPPVHPLAAHAALEKAGVAWLYPGFEAWFLGRVIPGLRNGERHIFTSVVDGALAGVAICKRSAAERKLCTLWVSPETRCRGIAAELASEAFAWLGTAKPLFTVPEERLPEFEALLRAWSFSDHTKCRGMYRPQRVEHVFNSCIDSVTH
jgi:hypothetical protein